MGWRRWGVLAAVGLGWSLGLPTTARADNNACFDAYEKTQRLRNDGKPGLAREQALICAGATCPGSLQKDCARWSDELGRMLATVVFSAHDENGQDVTNSAVFVDDRKVADSIDGKPVTLDPGAHKIRWESGDRKVETIVQLAAGETSRHVLGTFSPAVVAPPPPPVETHHRRIPTLSLVLGGVAGVGLVSFISFAAAGRAEQGCSPKCSSSQISTLRAEYAVADVSWITGLAALGTGITYWLLQPSTPPADAPPPAAPAAAPPPPPPAASGASVHLIASPLPGGAAFGLGGRF